MNIDIGDISVSYDDVGKGDPVVLVHGLAEDRRSWDQVVHLLSESRRMVCYDVRGHGSTSTGTAMGTLEQLADDLAKFLERVTGPATCVGFSLGGTIVLGAAVRHPELVPRCIVLGTSSVVGRSAVAYYSERIAQIESESPAEIAQGLLEDTSRSIAGSGIDVAAVATYRASAVGDGGGYLNAARAMRSLHDRPLTPELARVTCHVDVVGADRDTFCPQKAADILVAHLPDATFHAITGAGHFMNIDQPTAVANLLDSLLPS